MAMLIFFGSVFIISISGALQPGPVTATAITLGTQNKWAGTLLAIGHGIIEFPLMVIIILGMGKYFEMQKVQIGIGLAGGFFLLLMAAQIFMNLKSDTDTGSKALHKKPVLAGIILTASNPYFLLWWATVGLKLAQEAKGFGIWAFGIFAIVHWSVDLIWLMFLSWISCKGSTFIGRKGFTYILAFCGFMLLVFGLRFLYKAIVLLF